MGKQYFIKFGGGNNVFWKHIKAEKSVQEIPYSLYYSDNWTIACQGSYKNRQEITGKQIPQIEAFLGLQTDDNLWLFYEEFAYCYRRKADSYYDNTDPTYIDGNIKPKSLNCSLHKKWFRHELPEIFAQIDCNQKYNSQTIKELENQEKEVAEYYSGIRAGKIVITETNFLDYMSPIQLETLVFLIALVSGHGCRGYRGGTQKDFDLTVLMQNSKALWFTHLLSESLLFQIKKKKQAYGFTGRHGEYLVYLGTTDIKQFWLGQDWILGQVKQSAPQGCIDVKKWVKELFFQDVFDVSGLCL